MKLNKLTLASSMCCSHQTGLGLLRGGIDRCPFVLETDKDLEPVFLKSSIKPLLHAGNAYTPHAPCGGHFGTELPIQKKIENYLSYTNQGQKTLINGTAFIVNYWIWQIIITHFPPNQILPHSKHALELSHIANKLFWNDYKNKNKYFS